MSTQRIAEPLRDDEDLENLLEEIGDANPDAEAIETLIYGGREHDLIMVQGVDQESVELPDQTHGFDVKEVERTMPDDKEVIEDIVEDYDEMEMNDFEPPFEPAWISFSKPEEKPGL
ncbi:hypothetical protein [Natrinema altunense]|uniref:Uncharacterized protein n=1 Tax=Natrinema altunense (strain JCM 12890 / CGMCC 1.3731 / AJ2) TaxID=1227494 RepID=L9ZC95_NATA2|nr:hypothetical protein [Natrinema altunense]ELY83631.1 hypothetical protein C485_17802 [Natrinema altunense JCM 12890]